VKTIIISVLAAAFVAGSAGAAAADPGDVPGPSDAASTTVQTTTNQYGVAVPDVLPNPGAATPAAVERFVQEAQQDGLSDADIASLKSSGGWTAYPVDVTVEAPGVRPAVVSDGSDDALAMSAQPAATRYTKCFSGPYNATTVGVDNAIGQHIYTFTMGEGFCIDLKNIVIISKDDNPYIAQWIAAWAQALGWSWEGLSDLGQIGPLWEKWDGKAHGAVYTKRTGHMKYCPVKLPVACVSAYPWVDMTGYGNGENHGQGKGK
jgi:hypothetical protein